MLCLRGFDVKLCQYNILRSTCFPNLTDRPWVTSLALFQIISNGRVVSLWLENGGGDGGGGGGGLESTKPSR